MDLRVLGPVEASVGDQPVAIRPGKPRALLAMLGLSEGTPVSPEALIDGLWGEAPPATAPKMVHVYVSQLRKALATNGNGAEIVTRGRAYEHGAVRIARDPPARGATRAGGRDGRRARPRGRPPRRGGARAADADRAGAFARAPARPADVGAVPQRPPGRRARRVPARATSSSTPSAWSPVPSGAACTRRSCARTRRWTFPSRSSFRPSSTPPTGLPGATRSSPSYASTGAVRRRARAPSCW